MSRFALAPCRAFLFRHALLLLGAAATFAPALSAQTPQPRSLEPRSLEPRIKATVDNQRRAILPGSMSPRARLAEDEGELAPTTSLRGMTISFALSATQQADLDSLIAAQANPASPLYHQWLTPEQFGARFGMSDSDLAKVETWLESQGFTVQGVSRSRNQVTFSGSAAQAKNAFQASLHSFREGAQTHFAPSGDLSLPAAFAGTVADVGNLSDYRPEPHLRMKTPAAVEPRFTSSQSGNHFLSPKDVATLYDIGPAYNSGYNGAGQTIAVVGQSSILTTDIANFQIAAGLPVVAPTLVLVPNSGTPTVYTGDEAESHLDIEYSGAIAPGATILFVYTGGSATYDVFDAVTYAVNERLAPIISVSYGACEAALSSSRYTTFTTTLAQAATQGQTVIAASGDSGSSDCYQSTSLSTIQRQGVAVDFPASSVYVTGLGGTAFSTANGASTNTTYWIGALGNDVVSSVLSYIPEQVWNDDSTSSGTISLSASGGGTSTLNARPTWQAGVPGIPAGTFRLVPDVSLLSSPVNVGYLYCSSDSSTGVSGSCSNGFRDINNTTLTIAGGTSFAAPIFAGMVAIINQSRNSTGQGLINPTLYTLAANPTTYASAFHDITIGTNACTSGVSGCSAAAAASYAANAGYDQATGLGSVDFYKLLTAWPTGTSASGPSATTTTLTAATTTPAVSTPDLVTIKVAARSGSITPTGTVSLLVDSATAPVVLPLTAGTATYSFSSAIAGTHSLVATYSGDATFAASTSTLIVTIGTPPSTAAFSIAAPAVTVKAGSSATSTIRLNASNGYSGTVSWSLAARSTIANFCYSIANATLAGGSSTATTTLTVYTSSAACSSTTIKALPALRTPTLIAANGTHPPSSTRAAWPVGVSIASLLGIGLMGLRSKKLRPLLAFTVLVGLGMGLSGCSSDSTAAAVSSQTAFSATGNYTFTLTGTDTTTAAVNSSTTFAITVN